MRLKGDGGLVRVDIRIKYARDLDRNSKIASNLNVFIEWGWMYEVILSPKIGMRNGFQNVHLIGIGDVPVPVTMTNNSYCS